MEPSGTSSHIQACGFALGIAISRAIIRKNLIRFLPGANGYCSCHAQPEREGEERETRESREIEREREREREIEREREREKEREIEREI